MESPNNGLRAELRLDSAEEDARYLIDIQSADHRWQAVGEVTKADGKVDVEFNAEPTAAMPDWVNDWLRSLLRGAWRDQQSSGWPRRITRWRDKVERR